MRKDKYYIQYSKVSSTCCLKRLTATVALTSYFAAVSPHNEMIDLCEGDLHGVEPQAVKC